MFELRPISRQVILAFGGLATALSFALPAQAQQQQPQALERVTVTGTNIRRVDTETAAPVTVISREQIDQMGAQNVSDVIRSLSVDSNGSIPAAFGSGFAAGASGVSLRGLGVNSTLVLLNGRRIAPYGLADDGQRNFADLSSVPLDAIDRVEVLKDGASAIYGADAVGGVINIILRNSYRGLTVSANYGQTNYNDGQNYRVNVTGGWGDLAKDRFNIFANLEVAGQKEIMERDRTSRGLMFNQDMSLAGYDYLEFAQYGILIPGTAISGGPGGAVRDASGGFNYKFLPCTPGARTPSPSALGQYPELADNYSSQHGGPANCMQNAFDYLMVQPKEERVNLFVKGTFQLNSDWQAYSELSRFQTKTTTWGTPASVSSAWPNAQTNTLMNNGGIAIGDRHPDNPFTPDGAANRLRYHSADMGGRDGKYDTVASRILVGLKGRAGAWDIDAGALYSESKTDIVRTGFLRNSTLRDYLAGTNVTGLNPNLAYYRLGVNAGLNSAETNAAVSPRLAYSPKTSIMQFDARASRELMNLAGGPMAIAVGAEWRKEKLNSPPTPYTDQSDIIGLGYASFNMSRNVYAVFGELNAPVLKSLEASFALRYDHYSDFGSATTPKVGLKWSPMKQIAFRGTYAEAFRAPGAAESGNSASAGYTSFTDPLLCPITHSSADCSGTAIVSSTGNPKIKPEEAKTYTLGFVLEPTQNTSLSVDYWNFKRENEISQPDVNLLLQNPNLIPGAQIIRQDDGRGALGPNGEFAVAGVMAPYFNLSSTKTDGFDVDFRQTFRLGEAGRLKAQLYWTHIRSYKRTFPDGSAYEYAGSHGPTALSGNGGMPKDRGSFTLTWDKGPYTLAGSYNYVGSMKNTETSDDSSCLNTYFDGSDAPGGCRIGSFHTVDMFGKWAIAKNFEVSASVRNLFNATPPYDPQTYSAYHYNPIYHLQGAIGRSYSVGVRYTFF